MSTRLKVLAAATVLAMAPIAMSAAQAAPVLRVEQGKISGVTSGGVSAFLGLPYAAPPVGENRWRAPQPAASWAGIRAADKFGPNCPQPSLPKAFGAYTHEYLSDDPTSEDCLRLNVWTAARPGDKRPVLVWIHGGGFQIGSGSVAIYDGSALAKRGIIVVSINYRLGALGFFPSPEFRATGGGNFGIEDQIAALRWVKRNIAAFGGDPNQVTISGQSAGAISVHELILSPKARGLFARAIAESGIGLGLGPSLKLAPLGEAEKDGAAMLTALGAGTVEQARQLPLDKLESALAKAHVNATPYADGAVLPLDPDAALRAGHYNDTPVLIGMNADEGSALNPNYRLSDRAKYDALVKQRFGPLAGDAERLYPWANPSPFPALTRDGGIASIMNWGKERAATSRYPAYAYVFTHVEPGPQSTIYGAFHTSEVPYIFGTLDKAPERQFTADDRKVAALLSGYWVNFIRTGNPNGAPFPTWPRLEPGSRLIDLDVTARPYPPLSPEKLELFRRQVANGGSLLAM